MTTILTPNRPSGATTCPSPPSTDPRAAARAAFDAEAVGYQASLEPQQNVLERIRTHQRRCWLRHLKPGSRVLELGCGSGQETLWLAQQGFEVLATDVSPRMVESARARVEAAGVGSRVTWQGGTFVDWDVRAVRDLRLEGVVSSLGPLNCEPDLPGLGAWLGQVLPSGAPLICSIMPPLYLWEMALFIATGHPKQAFRRWGKGPHLARVGPQKIPIWYWRPTSLLEQLGPEFEGIAQESLGWFLPPPWAPALQKSSKILGALEQLDLLVSGLPGFRESGDHALLVARRR